MKLLLDTHVLLWWRADSPSLSPIHRAAIADPANQVYFSAASVWEIAIKSASGKLAVPVDFLETLGGLGFSSLPVTAEHAWATKLLPGHHADPFDRMLLAQSMVERSTLLTADRLILQYNGLFMLP